MLAAWSVSKVRGNSKALCIPMSHTCIIAVTTALDTQWHKDPKQGVADRAASLPERQCLKPASLPVNRLQLCPALCTRQLLHLRIHSHMHLYQNLYEFLQLVTPAGRSAASTNAHMGYNVPMGMTATATQTFGSSRRPAPTSSITHGFSQQCKVCCCSHCWEHMQ
jgi:hypothetical protein